MLVELSYLGIIAQALRSGTPSLAELGVREIFSEMNDNVLMLTRIPGSGAELLVLILQRLQGYNAFKHIRLPRDDRGSLSILQQVSREIHLLRMNYL